jgi:hypothetical protein
MSEQTIDPVARRGCGPSNTRHRIEGCTRAATGAAIGRALSQISHQLSGRDWTMASLPDTEQDADLRFWIAEHRPDRLH